MSNVRGLTLVESLEGYKYHILFEDKFSSFCWIYEMKLKSETTQNFLKFDALAKNLTNKKIKIRQAD